MGQRQLDFLLEGLLTRWVVLTNGISIILGFIGIKMIFEALHGIEINQVFGIQIPEISLEVSLGTIIGILVITTVASLTATRKDGSEIL
jgi:tellurite resistance protein TerC